MKTSRLFSILVVIAALLLSVVSSPASAGSFLTVDSPVIKTYAISGSVKIDSTVLSALSASDHIEANGSGGSATTDYFVWLVDRADLSPASLLNTKVDKGQFVYTALRNTAEHSQKPLLTD
jgi:hypothetical protein